ncbi:uncharacterized protein Smp_200850 [Schistosoma mansoni]|uniref:Smp_200850 n=1 Tax=Schistosoma mansoni TaxID=6183 RepID=G4VAC0_SCHMA|nr:uncharacterized protein Smp_200850 [Schistosoma mansoni]|eukprot:XP_018648335.1 uncharacterized protein Smp_200850 [Schistosoma mansoni]
MPAKTTPHFHPQPLNLKHKPTTLPPARLLYHHRRTPLRRRRITNPEITTVYNHLTPLPISSLLLLVVVITITTPPTNYTTSKTQHYHLHTILISS